MRKLQNDHDWSQPTSLSFLQPWRDLGKSAFRAVFGLDAHGLEHVPERGPCIVASNHPSYFDPLFVSCWLRAPQRIMTWDAVFRIPVGGWWARNCGAFPVDLNSPQGAIRAQRLAEEMLRNGSVLLMFPEGGRSHATGEMKPMMSGIGRLAARTGSPIVCANVLGCWNIWPRDRLLPRVARARLVFHPPIVLDEAECRARVRDREFHRDITARVDAMIREPVDLVRLAPRTTRHHVPLPRKGLGGTWELR